MDVTNLALAISFLFLVLHYAPARDVPARVVDERLALLSSMMHVNLRQPSF
jgi:hypothetical protein